MRALTLLKSQDHCPALFVINVSVAESWKLAAAIRKTKGLSKVPILLVSATDLSEDETDRAMKLAVQGFFKLGDKATLTAEIERAIGAG